MIYEGYGRVHPHEAHIPGIPVLPFPPIIPATETPVSRLPAQQYSFGSESLAAGQKRIIVRRVIATVDQHVQLRQPNPHNGDKRGKR